MIRPFLALLALACAAPSLPQQSDFNLTEAERTECTAKGGIIGREGKAQAETCHLPTTDAGKSCTSLDQCQSYICEVDVSKLTREQYRRQAPVTGKCTGRTGYWSGCQDLVIDGKYRGRCAD
jgi:hypothetical protein